MERCERDGEWLIDPAASRDPADGYLGQVLNGRYRVLAKLGAGSVGAVFRAEDLRHRVHVALKVLMPSASYAEPRAARRLRREAMAASQLDHPNIVDVTDFGEADGVPFLTMELVEGEELADVLERARRLSFARAVDIADQVASSLAHAHAKGVIHRDLKPENIHLAHREGRPDFVKVLDFGLVALIDTEGGLEPTRITAQNLVIGTPHYMAPEQITGDRITPATDLYALGVLLYRMTTAMLPFPGDDALTVMQAQLKQTPLPPAQFVREYPLSLDALVRELLEKDPVQRPPSADAVRDRLGAPELRVAVGARLSAAAMPAVRLSRSAPTPEPVDPARIATGPLDDEKRSPAASSSAASLPPAYLPPSGAAPTAHWVLVVVAWIAALSTLVTVLLLSGCDCGGRPKGADFLAEPEPKAAEAPARFEGAGVVLPRDGEVSGWRLEEGPDTYGADGLFEAIDGAAPGYLAHGFVQLARAGYRPQGLAFSEDVVIEAYRMKTPLGAWGKYSEERQSCDPPDGGPGCPRGSDRVLHKGEWFVRVTTFDDSPTAVAELRRLADAVFARTPGEAAEPEEARRFPADGLVAGSVTYQPRSLLGLDALGPGFSASYELAGDECGLGRRRLDDTAQAVAALSAVRAAAPGLAVEGSAPEPVTGLGDEALAVHTAEGWLVVARQGGTLLVAADADDRAAALAAVGRLLAVGAVE